MKSKGYGADKEVEGFYAQGDTVAVMEDVVTSGISIEETSTTLRRNGLVVTKAVVFIDREQGGIKRLASLPDESKRIEVRSVLTIRKLIGILHQAGKVDEGLVNEVNDYLEGKGKYAPQPPAPKPKPPTFEERAEKTQSAFARKLFRLMAEKKTNLVVAADVTDKSKLLELADAIGPEICMLKTHADIVDNFDQATAEQLKAIAAKHNFLLFEDRKFADIGFVARQQYAGGPLRIAEWADLVTVHLVAGQSVLASLQEEAKKFSDRGVLIIAEMSTVDTSLAAGSGGAAAVQAAQKFTPATDHVSSCPISFGW